MIYQTVRLDGVPTGEDFQSKVDALLLAKSGEGFRLKQVLQVRANYFLFIFEKEEVIYD